MKTIELLSKLVGVPSVFPHEKNLGRLLRDYLTKLGFIVIEIPTSGNRHNLVATLGKSNTYLGFYGHMDTVPPDNKYSRNPFQLVVRNHKGFGLGVADMKGGITAILRVAAYALRRKLPVKILFGVDEENISEGAHDLVSSRRMDDVGFLISAESGQVKDHHQRYSVCYGRQGRILFRMTVFGKTVHAAESHKGTNAIDEAANVIRFLNEVHFPSGSKLGDSKLVIHAVHGETSFFSVPDRCEIKFSLLTGERVSSDWFRKRVMQFVKQQHMTIELEPDARRTPYSESYAVNTMHPFVRKIEREVFNNDKVTPIYTTSVADENVFANRLNIPVMTIGPVGGGDHTADEWVDLDSIDQVVGVYEKILSLYTEGLNRT